MFIVFFILLILLAIAIIFDIGWLKTLLAVVAIVFAICVMPGVASMLGAMFPAFGAVVGAGSWVAAGSLLLGAYLLDPETVNDVIDKIGEVASEIGKVVADVVGDTASSLLGSLFSSPAGLVLLGIGGFMLYNALSDDSGNSVTVSEDGSRGELEA